MRIVATKTAVNRVRRLDRRAFWILFRNGFRLIVEKKGAGTACSHTISQAQESKRLVLERRPGKLDVHLGLVLLEDFVLSLAHLFDAHLLHPLDRLLVDRAHLGLALGENHARNLL